MKFDYVKLPLKEKSEFYGSVLLKPIIPIKIFVEEDSKIGYAALIDSGADFCIFDAEIGEQIGIDIESGIPNEFGGIQDRGGATAYLHDVTVTVGGWDYKTKVGFSRDIAEHGFGILGQKGFFDIFVVKFDYQKEQVELKERK